MQIIRQFFSKNQNQVASKDEAEKDHRELFKDLLKENDLTPNNNRHC